MKVLNTVQFLVAPQRAPCRTSNIEAKLSPEFDPTVNRAALFLSVSLTLCRSMFSLFIRCSWAKKKKEPTTYKHTSVESLSLSGEDLMSPCSLFTGSPSVKTNMGHCLKKRATREGRRSTWTHHDPNASISLWISSVHYYFIIMHKTKSK